MCLFVQKLYFASSFVKDLFVLFAQFVFVTDAFVRRLFGGRDQVTGPPPMEPYTMGPVRTTGPLL